MEAAAAEQGRPRRRGEQRGEAQQRRHSRAVGIGWIGVLCEDASASAIIT